MSAFVQLEDNAGRPVYVNADNVTYVRARSEQFTSIHFAEDHGVVVKGTAEQVVSNLVRGAMS